jgi:hypothetical protein
MAGNNYNMLENDKHSPKFYSFTGSKKGGRTMHRIPAEEILVDIIDVIILASESNINSSNI